MDSNTNNNVGEKKSKEKKPKQLTTDGGVVKEAIKKKSKANNDMDKVAFGAEVIGTAYLATDSWGITSLTSKFHFFSINHDTYGSCSKHN